MIHVLLADDQELLRDALGTVLGADPRLQIVGSVADGAEAVDFVRAHAVDVVLMDVRMPQMDGIRATQAVRTLRPETRVLVLTTFDVDEYVFGAIRAGASGFLTKDAHPAELAEAIVQVAAGDAAVSPRATALLLKYARHRIPSDGEQALAPLSPREREVALLLARGASNEAIGRSLYLTGNTVKTHVKSILAKLGLADRIQVVIWAYEHGVIEPGGAQAVPTHPHG
ncbi:response regulator [Glutamicibacter endophyticus]|uniref:response regulator n=1 Tax=Glutamicibacter endophyticus TaxID=1522174 RepID=UPI003AF0501A